MIYDLLISKLSINCVNFVANLRIYAYFGAKIIVFFVLYDETECKCK